MKMCGKVLFIVKINFVVTKRFSLCNILFNTDMPVAFVHYLILFALKVHTTIYPLQLSSWSTMWFTDKSGCINNQSWRMTIVRENRMMYNRTLNTYNIHVFRKTVEVYRWKMEEYPGIRKVSFNKEWRPGILTQQFDIPLLINKSRMCWIVLLFFLCILNLLRFMSCIWISNVLNCYWSQNCYLINSCKLS